MRTIKTYEAKLKVNLIAEIRDIIHKLEEVVNPFKASIREMMGEDKEVNIDGFIVNLKHIVRKDFDKDHLEKYLGDKVHEFEKITEFDILTIERKKKTRKR